MHLLIQPSKLLSFGIDRATVLVDFSRDTTDFGYNLPGKLEQEGLNSNNRLQYQCSTRFLIFQVFLQSLLHWQQFQIHFEAVYSNFILQQFPCAG
jgi:hypothetical protein